MAAAFLNAISINVFDFDDTHPRTIIHPTAPVAPALFALAEARQMTGADLLHAFVLGVETECRIGNAVSPGHYKRGWHITSTCGVFGAAAASGKILGLDERQMVWALGNASAQASGLIETLGSMAKSISVGNAARNGLLAALMARNGIEGPDRPIEGEWAFVRVTADDPAQDAITDGLGESFEILENTYKPYPCGVVLNPVIDGCLELRSHAGLTVHRVEQITVGGHPLLRERADRPAVDRGREAQVSTQHSIAVTLLRGKAGLAEFADAAVQDPEVRALRRKVRVVEDPQMPVGAAWIHVAFADGREIETRVLDARGSAKRPLTDHDLEAKMTELATHGCPQLDPGPLLRALWSLDRAPDAGSVMTLARVGQAR
jgi:2-methylcitrate dehydratase PrpD